MGTPSLERIRQKAEEYENRRKDTVQLQDQVDEVRLERIRQKAEEQEKMKQRGLEWNDKIQAIREAYGLSEEELHTLILEVEQEESDSPSPAPPQLLQKTLYEQFKTLFFSPKGRIGRGVFALSLIGTAVFQGLIVSLSSRGLAPLGLLALVAIFAQIMLYIKRFHDLDKSGLFTFLTFVPVLNFFVFIYLLFFEGTEGPNRFDDEQ